MDDLISRDDVYNVLKKMNIHEMPIYVFDKLWNGIRDLPSIEPERKKGNWIVKEEDWRKQLELDECSECGFTTTKQYNFCPNCGADMWQSGL